QVVLVELQYAGCGTERGRATGPIDQVRGVDLAGADRATERGRVTGAVDSGVLDQLDDTGADHEGRAVAAADVHARRQHVGGTGARGDRGGAALVAARALFLAGPRGHRGGCARPLVGG